MFVKSIDRMLVLLPCFRNCRILSRMLLPFPAKSPGDVLSNTRLYGAFFCRWFSNFVGTFFIASVSFSHVTSHPMLSKKPNTNFLIFSICEYSVGCLRELVL